MWHPMAPTCGNLLAGREAGVGVEGDRLTSRCCRRVVTRTRGRAQGGAGTPAVGFAAVGVVRIALIDQVGQLAQVPRETIPLRLGV